MARRGVARTLAVLCVIASLLSAAPASAATPGGVQQLGLAAGCREAAHATGCAEATPLTGPTSVVVSPNGKRVYIAAYTSQSVLILDRNRATGALSERPAGSRCLGP